MRRKPHAEKPSRVSRHDQIMPSNRYGLLCMNWPCRLDFYGYIRSPTTIKRTVNGQIPGANQHIERQEVALQKQMHMSVAM